MGIGAVEEPQSPTPLVPVSIWAIEAVQGLGDGEIARIAELQRGLVHREQLLAAGITGGGIKHRLSTGRLHSIYRDVYLVGRPRLEPLAAATAAVTHLRGHAVLSHRTAAQLWGLVDGDERPVTVTTKRGIDFRSRRGLVVHRSRSLSQADVRLRDRLPVTSPSRTLLDLAGVLDLHELEAAYAIAQRAGLATAKEVAAAIECAPRSKGVAKLRALLRADANASSQGARKPRLTRSGYERKLLELLEEACLPRPLANAKVDGMEVDLLWPEQKLIVEFDGFAYHSDRDAFERDRLRDQRLTAAGYRVIRVTARQLDNSPLAVISSIAMALAR